jgi:hypothetical protein
MFMLESEGALEDADIVSALSNEAYIPAYGRETHILPETAGKQDIPTRSGAPASRLECVTANRSDRVEVWIIRKSGLMSRERMNAKLSG